MRSAAGARCCQVGCWRAWRWQRTTRAGRGAAYARRSPRRVGWACGAWRIAAQLPASPAANAASKRALHSEHSCSAPPGVAAGATHGAPGVSPGWSRAVFLVAHCISGVGSARRALFRTEYWPPRSPPGSLTAVLRCVLARAESFRPVSCAARDVARARSGSSGGLVWGLLPACWPTRLCGEKGDNGSETSRSGDSDRLCSRSRCGGCAAGCCALLGPTFLAGG